ncbi:RNA polymerase sigma factor [Conexibacter woesei]|uniref:RNA polymerase sigma factor n=1 Tax=Conexibacter woesei TaxID=191495 RepID=UPI0004127B09|nr:RNA polymerase sigma factor [Conexibacter woesei]
MQFQALPDDALMKMARREPEAFAVVYRRHADVVLSYLLRRTGSIELASDLTAEVFAAALVSSRQYKAGPYPLRAWLFAIANHKMYDAWRRQRSERSARERLGMRELAFTEDEYEAAEQRIDAERQGDELWSLVADLPPDQREAVLGRVVDDQDYAELAGEIGHTQQTLRQRVSRGLASLGRGLREGTSR